MNLNELAIRAHGDACELGWYDQGITKTDCESLMMVVTEIAEAVEALRLPKEAYYEDSKTGKPEGYAVEVADAIIRLLDISAYKGWDMETIIVNKLDYNLTRGHRHGNKKL